VLNTFILLCASVSPWWMCLAGLLIGSILSNLAYVLFSAELLGWQKRRQKRLLDAQSLGFLKKISAEIEATDIPDIPERRPPLPRFPKTKPLFIDGSNLKPRQVKRMIQKLVDADERRFLQIEGGGNH